VHRRRSLIVVLLRDILCAVSCADVFKYAYHKRKTNFGAKESRAKTSCRREANVTG
jgi:hypothetical protein